MFRDDSVHLVGKIFLVLTFLAGTAATLLVAKLLHVRNERQKAYEQAVTAVESREAKLADVRGQATAERRRSAAVETLWHRPVVVGKGDVAIGDDGEIAIDIGTDVGFGVDDPERQADPVFYAFVGGPGKSVFVGPYRLVESRQTRSLLEPVFPISEEAIEAWPGGPWRLWESVPSVAPTEVTRLRNRLDEAKVTLQARTSTFARQERAVRQARDQLDATLRKLEGDPDARPIEGRPEVTDGLVAAIAAETADRDAALARLRQLRDDVAAAYATLTATLAENADLARRRTDAAGSRVARGD